MLVYFVQDKADNVQYA